MSKKYGGTVTQVYPESGKTLTNFVLKMKFAAKIQYYFKNCLKFQFAILIALNLYCDLQFYFLKGNLSKVLPEYLSKWTTRRIKEGKQKADKIQLNRFDFILFYF